MNWRPSTKATRRIVRIGFLTLILLVIVAAFFRINRPRDVLAYYGMAGGCHPVWRQFALRRIHPGDDLAEFLRRNPPSRVVLENGLPTYEYYYPVGAQPAGIPFTGRTVIARDGRLAGSQAWSCTWRFTFFDETGLFAAGPGD